MTKFIRDAQRYPHPHNEGMDEVADDMGPRGVCEACGHFAFRHSRLQCRFYELDPGGDHAPCPCQGMLWKGERFYTDPAHGPVERVR